MNLNLQTNACDPEQLESFLSGALSDLEERDFALHLNTCENCRRSLQQQAAEPEAWMEAEKLLRPAEFDAASAEEVSDLASQKQSTRQPLQIQNVLAALGPTDDPEMLGRLGGYEVSGVVGAGGMGVVLKAIDKSLDRTVAIKVLAPHLATSGAARKRFAREAKAAAAVLHPNVIAIHSVSNDESLPYLVMPYVRGTSLQKRLDREGPLSLQEILRIGSQIAAGLAAAHAQGLVHRDIKPANILLEDGVERVTITDFGLARAVDDATITHSGVIAGTPQYMSPEQARGEAVDGRSDLFSLGSVLYAICTGRPPFRAETTYGVMRRITDDEPASIRELNPDIPAWLCSIIARLMSKQAADRFASAAEVTELLEKCLAHVQQPAAVPLPASLANQAARGRSFFTQSFFTSRRRGVLAMIATVAVALLGFVLWQGAGGPEVDKPAADKEKVLRNLEGTWLVIRAEKGGQVSPKEETQRMEIRFVFKLGKWRILTKEGEDFVTGSYGVDASVTPKFIELREETPIKRAEPGLGIFEFDGDTLKLCWSKPGKAPPKEFKTSADRELGQRYYVLRREAKGAPKLAPAKLDDQVEQKVPGTVDSSSKGDEPRFSETKEFVLSMDSLKFMLDLDTGKTMDPPQTIRPEQEQMDLQTDQVQPYHYPTKLTGRGLVGLEVKASDWDASAAEVRLALTGKAVETLKEMDLGPEKNPTYFFKTRDGTLGILQLMELEEKPKGIRLRYKTMGRQSDRPAQGDEGNRDVKTGVKTDAAHPPSGASRDPLGSTGAVESPKDEAKRIVEQMRGISMQLAPRPRSDGKADPKEERKQEIMDQLRQLGAKAVPALVLALSDSDVQMRRNAELVMIHLAGPYSNKPRIDIKEALPALLKATEDPDSDVRAWAAHAIAEIGPGAKEAVPALIKLLQGKDEGGRNTSCMALGAIGPAAKDALPALRNALDDPSQDVRKFAQAAIKRIELPADAKAAEGQKGIADPNSVAKPKWARHLGTVEGLKSIACSPDGKLVAVANGNVSFPVAEGWKRAVVLLDGDTGKTVLSLPLATKDEEAILAATEGLPHIEVGPLAFSPDGTLLAVGTGLGQVKLFDPRTGELIRSLDDEQAKLDEKKTPEKLKSLKRAMGGVGALAFSPDSSLLAMCGSSFEDVARNWGDVRRLGRLGTGPGRLKVWDFKAGTIKHDLVGHSHAVAVSFSADGNLLASAGRWADVNDDGTGVIIWSALTGQKVSTILQEANSGTHAVVFSPTNKLVAIGSRQYDKENDTYTTAVSVAYALSGITQWKQTIPGRANPKAFSPDGKTVMVLCGGESIRFIKTETGEVQHEIKSADFLPATPRQRSQWFDFAISPTGPRLAIGGVDKERKGSVEIWSLEGLGTAANPGPAKDSDKASR